MTYAAPLADMRLTLSAVAGVAGETAELADQILGEAAKFAATELAPLNPVGDRMRSVLENGVVRTPPGFREAYRKFVEGGWMGLSCDPGHGGQGLPLAIAAPVIEMWNSACMGWALCPLLTHGAINMIEAHGSPEQKRLYLGKLVSGEWPGTMNLTEPQAGSDLGALRTRAVPANDLRWGEHYRIQGQKIFITYGDHDYSDNIIHMVLARTPDAPPGSRGISLFLVPKFLLDKDGKPGERNDLRPLRLEEKLGIHASPTCVMSYGDDGGAVGWMIGEKNRGLEAMFTMMNSERLLVGVQGVAIAERAYQQALDYARSRVQGRPIGMSRDGAVPPIVHHPDVRRMLLVMRAGVEAMRALAYYAAAAIDRSRAETEPEPRFRAERRADLLIPVLKAWCTDLGVEIASLGVQVHGGMGYIEETGAAQHLRDARIAPIYEGTNGIQANDLVGRKLGRDGGEAARGFFAEIRATLADLPLRDELTAGLAALDEATSHLVAADPAAAAAGSAPYLALFGTVAGGWLTARVAAAAQGTALAAVKLATARIYAEHYLARAASYLPAIRGGATIVDFNPDLL
ncbi:MAG TPA: acyl-CoA dehydrogenase [Stellaceae bacterium]|jgi:alkylation response protein AidB-like acyl-CoA dehydrogenase|nr:acyl-CoA dehydrogenase [Stellaceae bacterium]